MRLRARCRTVILAWADGGYARRLLPWAPTSLKLTVEVVERTTAHTFVGLRRRGVGERTLAWITRSRRTVRDYERLSERHAAMVHWSLIVITPRRLARHRQATGHGPPAPQPALLQAA